MISYAIIEYANTKQESVDVLEKAIVPTLMSIAYAPKTSPLADIKMDGILKFLSAITSLREGVNLLKY